MFNEIDIENLNAAKLLLSEISSFDANDTNGYNAALFRLKQSLELLGTLRGKGTSTQQNKFFKQISYLRNSLVHGVALLNDPGYMQQIKEFITNDLPQLRQALDNSQLTYDLASTDLYKSIARTSAVSNTKPNADNIELYVQTFNTYVEILKNIDLNKSKTDQDTPKERAAALNAILTLGEIAKQVLSNYPEGLEQLPYLPSIQIFSSGARNELAHAECDISIKRIKEIQSKLTEDLERAYHSEAATSVGTSNTSYQRKLQQLGKQFQATSPTPQTKARPKKRTREEEDLAASQQAAAEWEKQQGSIVTPTALEKKEPFTKKKTIINVTKKKR